MILLRGLGATANTVGRGTATAARAGILALVAVAERVEAAIHMTGAILKVLQPYHVRVTTFCRQLDKRSLSDIASEAEWFEVDLVNVETHQASRNDGSSVGHHDLSCPMGASTYRLRLADHHGSSCDKH